MIAAQLEARGIRAPRVLDAFRHVPRERFVPEELMAEAYADRALPLDCGQTISQPYMVALMTEALELPPGGKVLEVGTGSGYQTAILAQLASHVYTIEWHLKLMTETAARLAALGIQNVSFRCADGSLGWPERAPFDGILVTAGAPELPTPLTEQLGPAAALVVPVGPVEDQVLVRVRRTSAGFARQELLKCRFVKLWGQAGWQD
jgi:protein-L-isoaspartate(D-aspartate) O-methyltransferase